MSSKVEVQSMVVTEATRVRYVVLVAVCLFAVPGGLLGDKIGGRKVITALVLLFSLFTALTGVVHALWSLVLVRFLFGAAESSVGPTSSKVIARWLPPNQWG